MQSQVGTQSSSKLGLDSKTIQQQHSPSPNSSSNNNNDFKLHYKSQDVFGLLPKSNKIVVDLENNVKPWEPVSPLNPHDYLSKSMSMPTSHSSPSMGHNNNFNGASLSFGSTSARNLAIGLVKDGVGNEQILTLQNVDSSIYKNTNTGELRNDKNGKKHNGGGAGGGAVGGAGSNTSAHNPNHFSIDLETLKDRRRQRLQEQRIQKLQEEQNYQSPPYRGSSRSDQKAHENRIHKYDDYDANFEEDKKQR